MNIVDAACSKCGSPTTYDGVLPILCRACQKTKQDMLSVAKIFENAGLTEIVVSGEDIYAITEVQDFAKAKGCKVTVYLQNHCEERS